MNRDTLKVIVDFNVRHKAARDMIAGIMRYAAEHPRWELLMRGNHPANDEFATQRAPTPLHGLITGYDLTRADEEGQTDIRDLFCRTTTLRGAVFISSPPFEQRFVPVAGIDVNQQDIARAAARLLLRHNLTHFASIGSVGQDPWSQERIAHFSTEIRRAGYEVGEYKPLRTKQVDWDGEIDALRRWLLALPKPCGIFATFDQRALHVLDLCRTEGIDVPRQIQVVGVDNEESICELTVPSLTSIAPDFESCGYRAARELDRLMRGGKSPDKPIRIKSLSVVERLSTADTTNTGVRVSRALDFIRRNATRKIGVTDVVRAVGGSRRLLEKDFQTVHKRTIGMEIQEVRLQAVARALRSSTLSLSAIAETSGFTCESYLKTLFRKRFGKTMGEFRRG